MAIAGVSEPLRAEGQRGDIVIIKTEVWKRDLAEQKLWG